MHLYIEKYIPNFASPYDGIVRSLCQHVILSEVELLRAARGGQCPHPIIAVCAAKSCRFTPRFLTTGKSKIKPLSVILSGVELLRAASEQKRECLHERDLVTSLAGFSRGCYFFVPFWNVTLIWQAIGHP